MSTIRSVVEFVSRTKPVRREPLVRPPLCFWIDPGAARPEPEQSRKRRDKTWKRKGSAGDTTASHRSRFGLQRVNKTKHLQPTRTQIDNPAHTVPSASIAYQICSKRVSITYQIKPQPQEELRLVRARTLESCSQIPLSMTIESHGGCRLSMSVPDLSSPHSTT